MAWFYFGLGDKSWAIKRETCACYW